MKISVIVVAYNSQRTIAHTLRSFLEQDYRDKELIVIDGGSSDRTADIVRSMDDGTITLVSERDRGMYDAINKGLRLFSGDAVGCLNSDDRYHDSGVLSAVAEALADADVISGHLDYVTDHENSTVVRRWRGRPRPSGGFRSGWMPAHPTFYVRRNVVEAVGEYDLAYPTSSDYDWMLRAHELHAFRAGFLDRVMVDMMIGGRSTSGIASHLDHNIQALRSRRKWLGSGPVDYALFAKPLSKIGQFVPGLRRHDAERLRS